MQTYTETQFNKYRWPMIGFMAVIFTTFFYFFVNKFGQDTPVIRGGSITLGLISIYLGMRLFQKLAIRIDNEGVHYQIPFRWAKWQLIPWEEIDRIYVRECALFGEYPLGSGCYRQGPNGFAHAPYHGLFGLQIEKKSGGKYFLGTQYPEELTEFLANHSQIKPVSPA